MDKREKFCQSCAMPLTDDNLGTNEDNSISNMYCNLCYLDGKFTNENITFDEMYELGVKGISQSDESKLKK